MRSAPALLLLLLAVAGVGLGLRVMLRAPQAAVPTTDAAWPATIAGVPQGHVYAGIMEEPQDVNPFTTHESAARRFVLAYTHDALLDCDPETGELRPALAAAYALAADGTSCEFTLREGVRFADGAPLTMADVLFGWDVARAGQPLGAIGDAFRRIAAVEVIDDRRFRVTFRDAHYAALQAVGESWVVGQRQFFVDRVAEQAKLAGIAAPEVGSADFVRFLRQVPRECGPGTGPYVLQNRPGGPSTWRLRQDLLLVRNPHCWRREVAPGCWNFAAIRLLFRDPTAAVTALVRHEVDWFSSPDIDGLLRGHPDLGTTYERLSYDYRTLGVFRIAWNCRRTPYDLPEVRRALAMLFDLDAILAVFGGNGTKAKAFAKPDGPGYPHEEPAIPFDPAAARRLLRDAGFDPEQGTPLRLRLLAPQGLEAMRRTLDLFADACKQAGVVLQVRMLEWSAFVQAKKEGEWDALFLQQTFRPWADPYDFVHSASADNEGGWRNAEADRLAAMARVEPDPVRRAELWHELHSIVYREQPTTFLLHPRVALLRNVHVQGAVVGPLGLVLERAFVAPEFQRP